MGMLPGGNINRRMAAAQRIFDAQHGRYDQNDSISKTISDTSYCFVI